MPIIRDIVYGAAARGVSVVEFCKKIDIEVADLDDSEKRASFETSCLAWEHAVKLTHDPLLGLHIGQTSNPSILGLVGYLMQNSKTLLEAFKQVSEYGRIATNMFDYKVIEKKNEIILQYVPVAIWRQQYPNGARQAVDQAMAGTLNVFYLLSGARIYPVRVEMSKRKNVHEYEDLFRSPVLIKPDNQLVFKKEQLLAPVLRSDRSLLRVFLSLARQKSNDTTFSQRLRTMILNDFNGLVPPIEVLASKLNMTIRSLQRRLSAENTSYREISGRITKDLAGKLLSTTNHKVADVARILGYSGPRAFRRAYKGR